MCAGIAQGAGPPSAHARALGLRHVLDDLEAMLGGQRHDRVHVGRLPIKVNRHDRPRPGRQGSGDPVGIDVRSAGRRLDRHHLCPDRRHGEPGRDIGIGRHDDFVAGAEVPGAQHEFQCLEAIAQSHAMLRAAERRILRLEGLDLLAEHEPARFHDPGVGGIELRLELGVDRLHVEEGDHAVLAASRLKVS